MSSPKPEQFAEFYHSVHGYDPFPWQKRLAKRVCAGDWPRAIALPTAAGKTACIDIAVFALACRAKDTPRRIFFVVDRRIVVDQAHEHAKKLAKVLDRATDGVLREAADVLRDIAEPGWLLLTEADRQRILTKRWEIQDEKDEKQRAKLLRSLKDDEREWFGISPLDVYALRGGMYRESAWARSPLQPLVIASTVDQIGSRLLFRGYGVSGSMKPVHTGLVGNDSLILLDEAHCARPFDQTVQAVKSYRTWGEPNLAPFHFVSLTATPTEDVVKEEQDRQEKRPAEPKLIEETGPDDLAHPVLGVRIKASKPAALVVAEKAQGKTFKQWGKPLVDELAAQARKLMGQDLGQDEKGVSHTVRAVGVIVNRVATARALRDKLREPPDKKTPADQLPEVILLTGRMRAVDRDAILKRLEPLFSGKGEVPKPVFVAATQCLEVGADLDFHALVTECASLDALRQRFGRLNRIAKRDTAKAVIVIRGDQTEPEEKEEDGDPVYGNSLANTWQWLNDNADGKTENGLPWIDFGVSSTRTKWDATPPENRSAVLPVTADAPVLFPAHLDCWVQTNPIPTPDPDPALFLHGPNKPGQPDVQVVFRADLGDDSTKWAEIVALCPPSSSEAVPVPIGVFKRWMAGERGDDDTADVEGGPPDEREEDEGEPQPRHALRWRGPEEGKEKTQVVSTAKDVTPSDTYVVRISPEAEGRERSALRQLADLGAELHDYGDRAFQRARDRAVLRFTPTAVSAWPEAFQTTSAKELAGLSGEVEDQDEFAARLDEVLDELAAVDVSSESLRSWEWLGDAARALARPTGNRNRGKVTHRDCDAHPLGGIVVTGKDRLYQFDPTYLDDSEPAESFRGRAVFLKDHSRGVAAFAKRFAEGCGLPADLYEQVGLWHDLGKLDPRFQAMLKQSSPRTAVGVPLAKSAKSPRSREEREQAREVHQYPKGARHELLSTALVSGKTDDDLTLHLIATHHGSARPFADPVDDPAEPSDATPFERDLFDVTFECASFRQQIQEWNAELPERFWRVVRKYGWWGAAYYEAVFRLADHAQSRAEQEPRWQPEPSAPAVLSLPAVAGRAKLHPLPLSGLDGANPLAFLAAVGTLVVCDRLSCSAGCPGWLAGRVKLAWGTASSPHMPVLHLPSAPPSPAAFTEYLADRLPQSVEAHPAAWVVQMLADTDKEHPLADFIRDRCRHCPPANRPYLDWVTALACESAPDAASQLQTVRRDYLIGNLRSVMQRTNGRHLFRSLFEAWDYADALDNQSLHWEPSEDRRHAYQWHQPNGDPTRKRRGGMLGANRLALEAWSLIPSFPVRGRDRVATRGFRGNRAANTYWTWPLWSSDLTPDGVVTILSLPLLQSDSISVASPRSFGVTAVFRSQRILFGKTPNLTPAVAIE
jgi:CRISPR-associated endonuclease/helicase Cas3